LPPAARIRLSLLGSVLALSLFGCASVPVEAGTISYYGKELAGRRTASGERFDPDALTMAHRTLPLGTRVQVTDLVSRRSVVVRVNDRGPVTRQRIADISLAAARELQMLQRGTTRAELKVVERD